MERITAHIDSLLKTALYKCQNLEEAEDLVQETLVAAAYVTCCF